MTVNSSNRNIQRKSSIWNYITLTVLLLLIPLSGAAQPRIKHPNIVLWAWERKENLSFINPERAGVAFLAKTIFIKGDSFSAKPRVQSLKVPQGTWLMAVVRIRVAQQSRPLSLSLAADIAEEVVRPAHMKGVTALQIDFDARRSERPFYKALLSTIKDKLGTTYPISITALASWCVHEDWLKGLPIDEAVPMFFRMGPEHSIFLDYLQSNKLKPECAQSIGIALDEPIATMPDRKHLYVFNPKAWKENEVEKLYTERQQ